MSSIFDVTSHLGSASITALCYFSIDGALKSNIETTPVSVSHLINRPTSRLNLISILGLNAKTKNNHSCRH